MHMLWLPIALRGIDTPGRRYRAWGLIGGLLISYMIYSRIHIPKPLKHTG